MKRMISLLLALVLLIGMLPVSVQAATLDNGLEYEVYADHVEITDYTGDATELVIPGEIKRIPVTRIGDSAFYGCSSLTSLEIPDSVTYIGDSAFYSCTGLTSIEIPDSVTNIGDGAFSGCTSLTNTEIPDSVTNIGDGAFFGCTSLTGIEIPDSVTAISNSTFRDCSSLTYINLPDSITYIGRDTFNGCSSLTDIEIPNSVTSIGYQAFSDCFNLASIELPDTITSINDWTFSDCNSLTSIEIPDGVTHIGYNAFHSCNDLANIVVPDSVTYISGKAFFDCSSLTSIEIPDSVTYIGDEAFDLCESLTGIHVDENNPNYSSDDRGVLFDKAKTRLICAPGGIEGTYTVPDGVTEIGYSAFRHCLDLTGVELPDSVTSIGRYAFAWCESLTNINLPIGIICIDSDTFLACYSLPSIEIPCGVTYIGSNAFNNCNSLTNIYFAGDAPVFEKTIFYDVRATAHYPDGNATWTADMRQSYGGTLRWTPYTAPVHTHEYTSTVHTPTCTRTGLTVYTCICGDRYAADYIDALDHDYADGVCTHCGKDETDNQEPVRPSDPSNYMFTSEDNLTRGMLAYALWTYFGAPEPYFINQPFSDVCESAYYHDAVYWSVENGILSGTNPSKFNPDSSVNRAQAATFLWRAFGSPEPISEYIPFTDVRDGDFYADAVCWAWEEGYMRSMSATEFGTYEPCQYGHIYWNPDGSAEEVPGLRYLNCGDCIVVIGYTGKVTDLVIPAEVNGLPVTGIRERAFIYCSSLTSIVLPDTITSIGEYAFYNCTSLTHIDLPDSITSIGYYVFGRCKSLTSISIPESVTFIDSGAFSDCYSLTDIEIPDSVTRIENWTFGHCSSLTSIVLPDTVTYIGDLAIYGCSSLTAIEIPDSVTYIGNEAFGLCDSLTYIEIPDSVTYIAKDAFYYCPSLIGIHVDEHNLYYSSDDRGVLFDKAKTHLIQAPITISDTYTVPDSVTFIGDASFDHCADLTGIKFSEALISIGKDAFWCCSSLSSIYFKGDAPTLAGNGTFVENGIFFEATATIYYPADNPTWTADVMQDYQGQITWVPHSSNPFTDVPAGEWFYEPVLWAVEQGITSGTSETTFSPGNACMRAHVVTFLWRAAGSPAPKSADNPFVDVNPQDFFYKAVLWAVENGITNGADATHFNPTGICNRAQVVTFLHRAMGSPAPADAEIAFTDVPAGAWYTAPVAWAVENGITNGLTATEFGPDASCNRAQVVTFLYRAYS